MAQDGKKVNKHAVNLDDVPDQTLPMLQSSNNSQLPLVFPRNNSGNEASSEASDHVSNTKKIKLNNI